MKHLINGQKSSQIPPLSKTNDSGDAVLYFTDAERATLLNEYFTGFSNPPNSVPFFPDRTQDIFEILSITEQEVE